LRGSDRALLSGAAVVLVTIAVVAAVRYAGPAIYDGDGWYHVKYALILRDHGIQRTFPWFQESFLRDRFADLNLLYHLLLIPFVTASPLGGARVASVLAAGGTMGAFWWTARRLRVPAPGLLSIGLLALATEFTYRLTYTRPFVLAIGIALAATGAVLQDRRRLALVLAFVATHVHCSFHVVPWIAFLHDALRPPGEAAPGLRRFRTTAWSLAGTLAGCVASPYFPNDFRMWWVTNVEVLRASWAAAEELRVGTEMLPLPSDQLLAANLGVFAAMLAGIALLTVRRKVSHEARVLAAIAGTFFALTFESQRFVELWAPFTFLFAGVALRDAVDARPPSDLVRRLTWSAAAVTTAFALVVTLSRDRASARVEDPPEYLDAAAYLRDGVPAGETIFNPGWDEFPQLFYVDDVHRYLIGQDATFMWITDRERTRLWSEVARGRTADVYAAIRGTFRCRFAFVPTRYVHLLALMRRDPRFTRRYDDGAAVVYELRDAPGVLRDWTISGWWPDPARRTWDWALGAEPVTQRLDLRADGWVDLDRGARVPPAARDVCALATTTIRRETAGAATLAVATDDEVRVFLDGAPVYERSPYRQPPPGLPGGPPLPLEELFHGAGPREVEIPLSLPAGSRTLAVRACRFGDDFGFFARVW